MSSVLLGLLTLPLLQSVDVFDKVGVNHFLEWVSATPTELYDAESPCWSPRNSLIISYSNSYHFSLWAKQVEGLLSRGLWQCLENRFAFFALDEKSLQLCKEMGANKLCHKATNRDLVQSDFFQNDYLRIVYLKWDILAVAQIHFDYVFYFDADVLLLQNPWPCSLSNMHRKCDLSYQVDKRDTVQMNGGQILVRGKKRSNRIVRGFQQFREGSLGDQQIVDKVVMQVPKARICTLDQDRYVGHCNNPTQSLILDLVSYHAICMTGLTSKLTAISSMLRWANLAYNGSIENEPLEYDFTANHLTFSPVLKISSRDL